MLAGAYVAQEIESLIQERKLIPMIVNEARTAFRIKMDPQQPHNYECESLSNLPIHAMRPLARTPARRVAYESPRLKKNQCRDALTVTFLPRVSS